MKTKTNCGRALLLAVLLLAFISTSERAYAVDATTIPQWSQLSISMVKQDPDPVAPGEKVELKFMIENRGSQPANEVEIQLVSAFPFDISPSEQTKAIGTISGRQKGKDAVIEKFSITILPGAGTGTYPLALKYKSGGQDWIKVESFNVSIKQRDLPLSVSKISTDPAILTPGKESKVTLEVTNLGSSDAMTIRIKLNLSDNLPLYIFGSTNEKIISLIGPGQKGTAMFEGITNPSAKGGIYSIPLIVTYSDSSGKNYSLTGQSFGISVGGKPSLTVRQTGTETLKLNEKKKASVEIVNKGTTDIKFLTVELLKSESYEILSPPSQYIGTLDSGDSEVIGYDVYFTKNAPLELELQYSDLLNFQYTEKVGTQLRLFTSGEAQKLGIEKSRGKGIIITILIIIVGLFLYRLYRKRK